MPIGNKMSALGEKGRTKYEHCTTIAEMKKVKENYQDDLFGDEWNYNLSSLKSGSNLFNNNKKIKKFNADLSKLSDAWQMFYNSTLEELNCTFPELESSGYMTEYAKLTVVNIDFPKLKNGYATFKNNYELVSFTGALPKLSNGGEFFTGCSKLTTFNSSLPSLASAERMFNGTKLNKQSVINIIDTIPTYTSGTHNITIGINANELEEDFISYLDTLIDKGWTPTITWNGEAPRDKQSFIEQFDEEIILPEGYSRCEYLEDTGVQWIDTGYVPTNNTGLWVLANITSRHYDGYPMGSGINDTGISATRLYPKQRAVMYNAFIGFGNAGLKTTNLKFYLGKTNWLNDKKAIVDVGWTQDTYSLKETISFTPTLPIYIFRSNTGTSTTRVWNGRVFRAKISEGTEIIRDFIPCLDSDGKPCMYELLEGKTYYNQGTGADFTYKLLEN